MPESSLPSPQPAPFSGVARLFPLPNFVLFPGAAAPLHVFEPRYRELTRRTLEGDQCVAMALLLPGWQRDYEGRPPVAPVACLGRIIASSRDAEGRFNLLLRGERRLRLLREPPTTEPFRLAEAEPLDDDYPADQAARRAELLRRVLRQFQDVAEPATQRLFEQLFGQQPPLGVLVDALAFGLALPIERKQELLEELNVARRAELLVASLGEVGKPAPATLKSPWPEFSDN